MEKDPWFYSPIRNLVKLFYPKINVQGLENLPEGPAILVGNHCQIHGPIFAQLYIPGEHYIWCAGEMTEAATVPDYAYRDFWWEKPKATRWFYRVLSYIIAYPGALICKYGHTIPVYHDNRILSTLKNTVKHLEAGSRVVIFPEHYEPHNHILMDFQTGFVDVGRLYDKRTGRKLPFVPMYLAPELRTLYIGKPIFYEEGLTAEQQRSRVGEYLMEEITHMAQALPRHRVVPYRNLPKKQYPYNIPQEVSHETAGG